MLYFKGLGDKSCTFGPSVISLKDEALAMALRKLDNKRNKHVVIVILASHTAKANMELCSGSHIDAVPDPSLYRDIPKQRL
jgi:hypothetical protein